MRLPDFLHEQDGEIRLRGHRLGLCHVLFHYNQGQSAEMLREQFPTLSMAEIHKVLGFYWENKIEVDDWLAGMEQRLEARRAAGASVDLQVLRDRLAVSQGRSRFDSQAD